MPDYTPATLECVAAFMDLVGSERNNQKTDTPTVAVPPCASEAMIDWTVIVDR